MVSRKGPGARRSALTRGHARQAHDDQLGAASFSAEVR
jgi:hypothetical protein